MARKKRPARRRVARARIIREALAGPLGSLPTWAKVVTWVGLPSAMACFLTYFVTQQVTKRLDAISDQFAEQKVNNAALIAHMAQDDQASLRLIGIASRICLNTAKNDTDRVACVVVR